MYHKKRNAFFISTILIGISSLSIIAAAPPPAVSQSGLVASDHVIASRIGNSILEKGGNAVDAVIATAIAAGVVQPAGSGLGGGGFVVWSTDKNEVGSLDFRERAPEKSYPNLYVEYKEERPKASKDGGLAVATPNETQGLIELHRRFGTFSLQELVAPSIKLAQKGFVVSAQMHKGFLKLEEQASSFVRLFLYQENIPKQHDIIKRPRMAKTLKSWASSNGQVAIDGWVAQDWVDTVKKDGGILELDDIKKNTARERLPVEGKYRGWRVISMAPPSSGGVVLLQILAVLETYDISSLPHNSATMLHLYTETMQHAFADRALYMGDPERTDIPIDRLLSPARIEQIQKSIDESQTFAAEYYGTAVQIPEDDGTQHISIIDKDGFAVALTSTINTYFGSKVVGEKSGVVLNNQMDDFVAQPGVANAYGLVGSEANYVAPFGIPLSSMTPTILISPDGSEKIAIGASGGPFIISATLQSIINIIDYQMDPSEAIAAPRIHHQWQPRKIFVDKGISWDTQEKLKTIGHEIQDFEHYSSVQIVHYEKHNQTFWGASDPRKGGWPQ